jgi:hypothetical protein
LLLLLLLLPSRTEKTRSLNIHELFGRPHLASSLIVWEWLIVDTASWIASPTRHNGREKNVCGSEMQRLALNDLVKFQHRAYECEATCSF